MSLADRCSGYFDRRVQSRGETYLDQSRVAIHTADDDGIDAVVAGRGDDYSVFLDWTDAPVGILCAACSCPYFEDGGFCKHLWATLRAVDAAGLDRSDPSCRHLQLIAGEPALTVEQEPETGFGVDDWLDSLGDAFGDLPQHRADGLPAALRGLTRGNRSGPKWQRQLADIADVAGVQAERQRLHPTLPGRKREAWYLLDISACMRHGGLVIRLHQRETRQTGEFGKIKRLNLEPGAVEEFTTDEDRTLLPRLLAGRDPRLDFGLDGAARYDDRVSELLLQPQVSEALVPELCATGRFVWLLDGRQPVEEARAIAWDDGPPWRFRLRIDEVGKRKKWRVTGELLRPDEEPVPLDRPVLLLDQGLVLFEDRLARLHDGGQFHWIAVLRRDTTVEVPRKAKQELIRHLWQGTGPPELEAPESLQWPAVRVEPRGWLRLRSPQKPSSNSQPDQLLGTVAFDYEGRTAHPDDPEGGLVDADQERVLLRDRDREQTLLDGLQQHPVKQPPRYLARDADFVLPSARLDQLVNAVVPAGWTVEADGRPIRRAGAFRLSVTSGVDWFDLEGEFDFDGATARMPELLAAAREGSRYVTLDDGSQGLLPRDWLSRYGALAELGEEREHGVRFRQSQAALLDALLAAQEQNVSVDERFAEMRRKVHSFKGVAPRREPEGFRGRLREYQTVGLGWLSFLQEFGFGGCLADDMGLGKTIQVLALLEERRRERADGNGQLVTPSLAVVPKSLVFNWIEEASRFTPELQVINYTGPNRKEHLERLAECDLLVTTYGTLRRDITELKDVRFDYAILDEAQAIKNPDSQSAKACRLIDAIHRLAMTGTPVENHLGELWSLFEFLNPGMLGRSRAFQRAARQADENGTDARDLVSRAVGPFLLRRTKQQVLSELPEKIEQTLHCDLTTRQRKQYNELRDYYRAHLGHKLEKSGLAKSKMHVLEALLRLRQAACHPGLLDKQQASQRSAKFDVLLEQLDEILDEGHKALVFSQFTTLLGLLRKELEERGIAYEYLDGRVRKRERRVRRFQEDPQCPLFLISLKAGGHGLNLTAADYVYILDPWWNPAVEAQAVDRAHRIGQTSRVIAYRIIARETVEEKIVALQQSKRELADSIVAADESVIRNLTEDDLQFLLN